MSATDNPGQRPSPSMTQYHDGRLVVWGGDCLDLMASLPPDSVDAIVTDPPYGLGFMGKKWDTPGSFVERKADKRNSFDHVGGNHNPTSSADAARTRRVEAQRFGEFCADWSEAAYRVLKPGGHILAFGGTRTWHRLAVAIEDAGFEIRDSLAWLYGSGFPKSMNVGKAIDKAAGFERTEKAGVKAGHENFVGRDNMKALRESGALSGEGGFARPWMHDPEAVEKAHWDYKPSAEAEPWEGWGTALKPAFEPIVMGRKPLPKKATVASNVLLHGTGALNIDACRVETTDKLGGGAEKITTAAQKGDEGWTRPWMSDASAQEAHASRVRDNVAKAEDLGRFPANVVLDESQAEALDRQAPKTGAAAKASGPTLTGETGGSVAYGALKENGRDPSFHGDIGGASRFFYVAKAPKSERPVVELEDGTKVAHPTVKPVAIMRWLVRLVTPPGGLVLDPFAGTGTTGEACVLEGFRCLLAEDPTKGEQDYLPLIDQRITRAVAQLAKTTPKPVTEEQSA